MNAMQTAVSDFCEKHNLNASKNARLLDLVSEIGELAKEFLKATSYGQKGELVTNEAMTLEVGDLLFSALALASSLNIDAHDALNMAIAKYEKRIKNKNSPSS